ncbi:hypothetical protein K5D69_15340 [Pseudomonas cichorii]|uniref:hypothetical protein n=1 Tax=Pseudomonas cichorii TaxID=36746 RepID=UPI001C8A997D|nr:hypothetical protein [Pseudomonas cichorii]MBX8516068.1 hypothetical protein [Pseudomonas cichorii]
MSAPKWADILINIERAFPPVSKSGTKLNAEQVDELKAVENAAECFNLTIGHGMAAVGELIAQAAHREDLDMEAAHSLGWLVNSLALLSMTVGEAGAAASYKLQNTPQEGGSAK